MPLSSTAPKLIPVLADASFAIASGYGPADSVPGRYIRKYATASAPTKLKHHTVAQLITIFEKVSLRSNKGGISKALLPVNKSAPRTTTSIGPIGKRGPKASSAIRGYRQRTGKPEPTASDKAPPKAIYAPARILPNIKREKPLRDVAAALLHPAPTAACNVSEGVRTGILLSVFHAGFAPAF